MSWEIVYFETEDSFNEYVGAPDYLTEDKHGICFGFQMRKRGEHDYSARFYFDDQAALGGVWAVGIPN